MYCRVPQDSQLQAVRGARNTPCATVPGKRAPTVKMCESGEQYVPLNDGTNWKGDPNATLSGQGIPQLPPGSPPPGSVAACCRGAATAGGGRIRPSHWHLRGTGRKGLYAVKSGAEPGGPNLAEHAGAPELADYLSGMRTV